jgi:hypothetical protein
MKLPTRTRRRVVAFAVVPILCAAVLLATGRHRPIRGGAASLAAPGAILPAAGVKLSNEGLRAELVAMRDADQAEVKASMVAPDKPIAPWKGAERARRLKEIIQENGWPTISQVGAAGAAGAWIVVQHDDEDPQFQMNCVPLIRAAAAAGEAQLKHMACLTDRALTAVRQRQLYGTQGAGGLAADRPAINARRKAIGLPSLEEYAQSFQDGTGVTTCGL